LIFNIFRYLEAHPQITSEFNVYKDQPPEWNVGGIDFEMEDGVSELRNEITRRVSVI